MGMPQRKDARSLESHSPRGCPGQIGGCPVTTLDTEGEAIELRAIA